MSEVKPLNILEVKEQIPRAFQPTPAKSRTNKYTVLNTVDALKELQNQGWLPYNAFPLRKFNPSAKQDYSTHCVKLRHINSLQSPTEVGETIPEIILINSYTGMSSFKLLAGHFRLVCENGMVVMDDTKENQQTRVIHRGELNLKEIVANAIKQVTASVTKIDEMKHKILTVKEQRELAKQALTLRTSGRQLSGGTPIIGDLLKVRRPEDEGNNAWLVLNRLQEAIIRGGIRVRGKNGQVRTMGKVRSDETSLQLNQKVWDLVAQTV